MRIDRDDEVTVFNRKLTKENSSLSDAEKLARQDELTKLMESDGGYAVIPAAEELQSFKKTS